jgi:hypothetical protein
MSRDLGVHTREVSTLLSMLAPGERHVLGSVYTTPLPTVDDTLDGLPWVVSKMPTKEAGGHVRDLPGMISTEVLETNKLMEIGERILSTV